MLLLLANALIMFYSSRTEQSLAAHEDVWDASMDPLVSELKLLPHFGSLTLAYGDAGYVVYKSGIRHVDLVGLNDTRIAHARTAGERMNILLSENPDILLLPAKEEDSCYRLVEDAYGVARTNQFIPIAYTQAFPYPLVLYLNNRSPFANEIPLSIDRRLSVTGTLQYVPVCLK